MHLSAYYISVRLVCVCKMHWPNVDVNDDGAELTMLLPFAAARAPEMQVNSRLDVDVVTDLVVLNLSAHFPRLYDISR